MLEELRGIIQIQNFIEWGIILLVSIGLSTFLISFYTRDRTKMLQLLKQTFFSMQAGLCLLVSGLNFLFCVLLYGEGEYAWFMYGVIELFFVLAFIDARLLAVPDVLNFLLLFSVFVGLYYFNQLHWEHFLFSFALCGAFALLRIFGSFVFAREIMGEADLVVLACIGAIFPSIRGFYVVVLASVLAMGYLLLRGVFAFKDKQISLTQMKIPFVLFLFLGCVLSLLNEKFLFWEGL